MHAKIKILISLVLALCVRSAVIVHGQQQEALQKVRQLSDLRARTLDERARSELFDYPAGQLITGPVSRMIVLPNNPEAPPVSFHGEALPTPRTSTRQETLQRSVCSSEVVIIGTPLSTKAMLNKSETFLFSDIVMNVANWIRPGSGEQSILVTVFGGQVDLAGEKLSTLVRPLPRIGQLEAFFLVKIPKQSGFRLQGEPIQIGSGGPATLTDVAPILNDLREAAKSCSERAE